MKRILALLMAALMLFGALAGCTSDTPVDTSDSSDTSDTADTSETESADTEPPVEETPAYASPITVEYENFTLNISAPTVVFQGEEGDQTWGHHQFPRLYRSGKIIVAAWNYGEDRVGASGKGFSKISVNGGKSWMPDTGGNTADATLLMENGKYFAGFRSDGTPKATFLNSENCQFTYSNVNGYHKVYFAEDIADNAQAVEKNLTRLTFNEYDPETKTTTVVEATLNWPYAPIVLYPGDYAYSLSGIFSLSGQNVIATADGKLYTCIYTAGFDSFAASREEAITGYARTGLFQVYVFASADSGRTWDLISQVTPSTDISWSEKGFEGFCEPKMIELADGDFLMLMRTGGNSNDMYVTRSTDRGVTWTTPEVFDEFGVLPQLNQFDSGITIATYGRPYLRLRVTDDPTGAVWEDPVEIPLAGDNGGKGQSCFYTNMLKLDDGSILFVYTNRQYPNKNGVGVLSVLTRIITVTPNE